MQGLASLVASKGRGEDTTLVHMTPREVGALQGIATLHGGSLTINPSTGLPEAGFLGKILPMVAAAVATFYGGPAAGAAAYGGVSKLEGNSWGDSLKGAALTYVGGSLASGAGGAAADAGGGGAMDAATGQALTASGTGLGATGLADGAINAFPVDMSAPGAVGAFDSGTAFIDPATQGLGALPAASTAGAVPPSAVQQAVQRVAAPETLAAPTPTNVGSPTGATAQTQAALEAARMGATNPSDWGSVVPNTQEQTLVDSLNPQKSWLQNALGKYGDMSTYYNNATGKLTGAGMLGLGGLSLGVNMLGTNAANKAAQQRYNMSNPYMPGSTYQNYIASTHKPYAEGGITGTYPNRTPQHEVVQPGVEPQVDPFNGQTNGMAGGGVAGHARYLQGPGDGMSDSIPAHIDGKQPAALATSEFVIPADVVSHLGNGSSEAGAKHLYSMMDRIRKARTGNLKQGKQIDAGKFLPA